MSHDCFQTLLSIFNLRPSTEAAEEESAVAQAAADAADAAVAEAEVGQCGLTDSPRVGCI